MLFEIFDFDKLEQLSMIRKNAISCYLNKLSEKPVFAILFGSTAKETYTESSDIDILIVTNKKTSTKEAEKETDALTAIKVSTFQITYADFLDELKLKKDKVIQSAVLTGYPLINHISYYEVILNERI